MSLLIDYRPQTFKQFYGNRTVLRDLNTRLKKGNPPQSILFTGPSGVGKTTLARIFAHKVGCTDIGIIEHDARDTLGIQTIRNDLKSLRLKIIGGGKSKALLYDECHQLTKDAQEAFLKPTEEPPANTYFLFCTTDPASFKDTLRNRCTIYQIRTLSEKESRSFLLHIGMDIGVEEGFLYEEIFDYIIKKGAGVPRNILKMLEQIMSIINNEKLSKEQKIRESKETIDGLVFIDDSPEVIEISRLLFQVKTPKQIRMKKAQQILFKLRSKNINVEAARRGVLNYINSVALNPKSNASKIAYCTRISIIFSEPTFNTGFAGFCNQCLEAFL